ncbi:hypothetical protein [Thermococcus sp. Bubb.Bath]|uniref:hypothetical protein n=1 Tax=Thermococcus sp. Bubb.Bath TaxID=1638242 RepID=UPI00143C085B|nr:hypothetical protein [Thermococcus sp. Bubb.Bath]NJF24483.1 hypothetical protein [Thermococcus sp. Bubb.Bath]
MRQKIVWFVLGVLIGSLFVVAAYPTSRAVQYGVPTVQKIDGSNYTAYLLYNEEGLPLNTDVLKNTVQKLAEESTPNAKWHAYAVPGLPKGLAITGYGMKVTQDGRVDILITVKRAGSPIDVEKIQSRLLEWSKKAPTFKPDRIPKRKIGVPKGWEVKTVGSNGNVKVYSTESSPYWHNFGRVELNYDDSPYGKLYAQFSIWGLWNDGNPNEERLLCTTDEDGHGTYRVTPGVAIGGDYGSYFTDGIKITHDWGIDSALSGRLGEMKPAGTLEKDQTMTISIGPVSYPIAIGGYKVYGDAIDPQAIWNFDIPYNEDSSHHTIEFMPSSEGIVKESTLHDGSWHTVIRVTLWARFRHTTVLGLLYHHDSSVWVDWTIKVG